MNRPKVLAAVVVSLGATVIAFSAVKPDPRLQIEKQRVTTGQRIRGGDGHDVDVGGHQHEHHDD